MHSGTGPRGDEASDRSDHCLLGGGAFAIVTLHTEHGRRCILYGMPIESSKVNSVAVVKISGRLVFGREVDRLETVVSELMKEKEPKVVFDLSALDYVDSSGIGTMV